MKYYIIALRRYAAFSGRATRSEFWYFVLFTLIAQLVVSFAGFLLAASSGASSDVAVIVGESALGVYVIATTLPGIAVSVRRLHDIGMSGLWLLLALIPMVGVVLYVFWARDSQPGTNKYGPNPKSVGPEPRKLGRG
jgi:uncharacterized membrane protein YhaH (DUF805 family)